MTLIGIAAIGFLLLVTLGARAFGLLLLIAIGLVVWIGSRAPVMDTRPEPIRKTDCSGMDFRGLPQDEVKILRSTCY